MKRKRIGLTLQTIQTVIRCSKSLMGDKPRHGLPAPIESFELAPAGTEWFGRKIHFWVMITGRKIGLRVFEHASRPKRRVLRDLMAENSPPTLLVYDNMGPGSIIHKLAQCIKIGLSRMRKGLIECIKEKVDDGLVERCDNGNFVGRIPNQFELSMMQSASG